MFASLNRIALRLRAAPICLILSAAFSYAQTGSAPVLTLADAIQIALKDNRPLKIVSLEVKKAEAQAAVTRSQRLPAFEIYNFTSQPLLKTSFQFPEGAFGSFPSTGPIPPASTTINSPARITTYLFNTITQPLSQLYKLHLAVRLQELSIDASRQKVQAQRQAVVANVKQAYYTVLQTETAIHASEVMLQHYRELDREMVQYVTQQTVLKSDSLEVKAKLAQEELNHLQLGDQLQSQKEYLNDLLGRDIRTEFQTEPAGKITATDVSLAEAQDTALSHRPEIKQAEIAVRQAEYDRRLAKAQYIPDVGVAFHYLSNFNVDVLPRNFASVGLEAKWEPWDWGRRGQQVQAKQFTLEQSQEQLRETKTQVLLDVNNRFRKLAESRARLGVVEAQRDAAQEKLRVVTNRFRVEASLLRDLYQQEAALASADQEYAQAVSVFWTAKAEFEKSLGEP
jgi:outer membrane protein TolC